MAFTERYVTSVGGGAHDGTSEANAWTMFEMTTALAALGTGGAAGLRVNVKADATHSLGVNLGSIGGGTTTAPCWIRGYHTTPGDGWLGRTVGGTGPIDTSNMPLINFGLNNWNQTAAFVLLDCLNVTSARNSAPIADVGTDSVMTRCVVTNTGTGVGAACASDNGNTRRTFQNCDFTFAGASGGANVASVGVDGRLLYCRIRGAGAIAGVRLTSRGQVIGCVIFGAGGAGIYGSSTGSTLTIIGNTIVGNSGDGIDILASSTTTHAILNNLITDNGGYGIDGNGNNAAFLAYNRFDRNTSGAINGMTDWDAATGLGRNTTSVPQADEYENAGSHDYRLKSTSPALAAGLFPYADMGAVQRQASSGSGGRGYYIGA